MAIQYTHLSYEEYKALQKQMKAFEETTHKSTGGFYHKSIRLKISDGFIMEFHGPLVGGYWHNDLEEVEDGADATERNEEVQVGKYEGL